MTLQKENIIISKPKIFIDEHSYERLFNIAKTSLRQTPEVAEFLLNELSRASILASDMLPSNVVRLGSNITYSDDSANVEHTVYLVWPNEADIDAKKISVLTPIGAALLGLSEGDSIDWRTNFGHTKQLTVTKVY